jgi:hypothetical protein
MTTIMVLIERQGARNTVRVTVGQQIMFSADHVAEEVLPAVVRCVGEYWIGQTAPVPGGRASD